MSELINPHTLTKKQWPPNYVAVSLWRSQRRERYAVVDDNGEKTFLKQALAFYAEHPVAFINHWVDTYDPRNATANTPTRLPLIMFEKQRDLVQFLHELVKNQENGLVDKSRDMGATWVCCAFSVWAWLFLPGASIGWGSRKQELVDKLGDLDSIFEKLRQIVRGLPPEFLPCGFSYAKHMSFMRILNPENGASVTGEVGDGIGRGGRKTMFFKDESAHYEHPELIEAALGDNTRVQVDISTVNGLGTVYDRKRESAVEWRPGEPMRPGYTQMVVMDWSDHPTKTQEWYDQRQAKAKREGLIHKFRQEVDRNPAASLVGIIIPSEWVNAAVDAHAHLGFGAVGGWMAAMDVADEGGDLNALTARKGVILKHAEDWAGDEDGVPMSARLAIAKTFELGGRTLQYDCCGIGAGVKTEAVRLRKEKKLPSGFQLVAWDAGQSVLNPKHRVIQGDRESPLNEDYYANLKAQGWWALRRRFEKTYQMRTNPELYRYKFDELISLPSELPRLAQVKRELSQPTIKYDGTMRILVDKKPDGAKSPNLGDAIMMTYFPLAGKLIVSDAAMARARAPGPARQFAPIAHGDQTSQFT